MRKRNDKRNNKKNLRKKNDKRNNESESGTESEGLTSKNKIEIEKGKFETLN